LGPNFDLMRLILRASFARAVKGFQKVPLKREVMLEPL
jgi:hypothetical protein